MAAGGMQSVDARLGRVKQGGRMDCAVGRGHVETGGGAGSWPRAMWRQHVAGLWRGWVGGVGGGAWATRAGRGAGRGDSNCCVFPGLVLAEPRKD